LPPVEKKENAPAPQSPQQPAPEVRPNEEMNGIPSVEESYGTEFIRKGIHFLSLLIPIIYYFVPRATVLWMLVPLTLLFSLSDAARLLIPSFGRLYSRLFGFSPPDA